MAVRLVETKVAQTAHYWAGSKAELMAASRAVSLVVSMAARKALSSAEWMVSAMAGKKVDTKVDSLAAYYWVGQ